MPRLCSGDSPDIFQSAIVFILSNRAAKAFWGRRTIASGGNFNLFFDIGGRRLVWHEMLPLKLASFLSKGQTSVNKIM